MEKAFARPSRQRYVTAALTDRLPAIFLVGLVTMCLFPRFFYISVLGKGINTYYILSYIMALDVLRRLATSANLLHRVKVTVQMSWTPIVLIVAYHAARIYSDTQSEDVLHSLAYTVSETFSESIWLLIAIVYLNSLDKITYSYRVILFCCVLFFVFAGIEYFAQTPLMTVLRLNNFAVGDKDILASLDRASSQLGQLRIKGIFVHPIIFGQIAGACAPLAIHAWRYGRGLERYAAILILLGELALPSLTGARTAIVSPMIAVMIYFAAFTLQVKNRRRFLAFVAAALFMATASPLIIDAATTVVVGENRVQQRSTQIREIQFAYGQKAIERRPVFGYGSDNSLKYAGIKTLENSSTIDNYYLSEAIDHGIVGLTLFSMLLMSLFYACLSMAVREKSDVLRSLLSAISALVATPAVGLAIASISAALPLVFFASGTVIAWRGLIAMRRKAN